VKTGYSNSCDDSQVIFYRGLAFYRIIAYLRTYNSNPLKVNLYGINDLGLKLEIRATTLAPIFSIHLENPPMPLVLQVKKRQKVVEATQKPMKNFRKPYVFDLWLMVVILICVTGRSIPVRNNLHLGGRRLPHSASLQY
jgi:hypothetical protein